MPKDLHGDTGVHVEVDEQVAQVPRASCTVIRRTSACRQRTS